MLPFTFSTSSSSPAHLDYWLTAEALHLILFIITVNDGKIRINRVILVMAWKYRSADTLIHSNNRSLDLHDQQHLQEMQFEVSPVIAFLNT